MMAIGSNSEPETAFHDATDEDMYGTDRLHSQKTSSNPGSEYLSPPALEAVPDEAPPFVPNQSDRVSLNMYKGRRFWGKHHTRRVGGNGQRRVRGRWSRLQRDTALQIRSLSVIHTRGRGRKRAGTTADGDTATTGRRWSLATIGRIPLLPISRTWNLTSGMLPRDGGSKPPSETANRSGGPNETPAVITLRRASGTVTRDLSPANVNARAAQQDAHVSEHDSAGHVSLGSRPGKGSESTPQRAWYFPAATMAGPRVRTLRVPHMADAADMATTYVEVQDQDSTTSNLWSASRDSVGREQRRISVVQTIETRNSVHEVIWKEGSSSTLSSRTSSPPNSDSRVQSLDGDRAENLTPGTNISGTNDAPPPENDHASTSPRLRPGLVFEHLEPDKSEFPQIQWDGWSWSSKALDTSKDSSHVLGDGPTLEMNGASMLDDLPKTDVSLPTSIKNVESFPRLPPRGSTSDWLSPPSEVTDLMKPAPDANPKRSYQRCSTEMPPDSNPLKSKVMHAYQSQFPTIRHRQRAHSIQSPRATEARIAEAGKTGSALGTSNRRRKSVAINTDQKRSDHLPRRTRQSRDAHGAVDAHAALSRHDVGGRWLRDAEGRLKEQIRHGHPR